VVLIISNVASYSGKQIVPLKTLAKGLEILLAFSGDCPTLSSEKIAEQIGVPRSTVYRYLQTLLAYSFLEHDHRPGHFRLGSSLLELADSVKYGSTLTERALPLMRWIRDETGESVFLCVAHGNHAVCIERVESVQSVKFSFERGRRMPLHAGASAKVLLAFMDKQRREGVLKWMESSTEKSKAGTDVNQLRAELSKIRQRGYAFSQEEVDPGAWALAVPVLKRDGRLLASLSVGGPVSRLPKNLDELATLLASCAKKIAIGVRQ